MRTSALIRTRLDARIYLGMLYMYNTRLIEPRSSIHINLVEGLHLLEKSSTEIGGDKEL